MTETRAEPQDIAEDSPERRRRGFFGELPFLIIIAFVLALLLKTFVVQAFYIPSASMEPTLLVGDRVLVNKMVHWVRSPRRGEVVVFSEQDDAALAQDRNLLQRLGTWLGSGLGFGSPGERDFIKRVIGLPGDRVEMRDGVVYVNGVALQEALATEGGYLSQRDINDFGPVVVEPDHYFVLGDNRPNSSDSRFSLGQIPAERVIGRAFVVIWPLGSWGTLPIADYGNIPPPSAAAPATELSRDGPAHAQQLAGRAEPEPALAGTGAAAGAGR